MKLEMDEGRNQELGPQNLLRLDFNVNRFNDIA